MKQPPKESVSLDLTNEDLAVLALGLGVMLLVNELCSDRVLLGKARDLVCRLLRASDSLQSVRAVKERCD